MDEKIVEAVALNPGRYCVPTAIAILSGNSPDEIAGALDRHRRRLGFSQKIPGGARLWVEGAAVLKELGFDLFLQTGDSIKPYGDTIREWARYSQEKYPQASILVSAQTPVHHAVVIKNGKVFDTYSPHGMIGGDHIFAEASVPWAAFISSGKPQSSLSQTLGRG